MEDIDNLSSPVPPASREGMLMKELPAGTQIFAPMDGTVSVEYNEKDQQPDGSLNRGKVVIESKGPNGNVIRTTVEASNIGGLLVGKDVPTQTSEEGTVKSSQGVPVKAGEPLITLKNNTPEIGINTSVSKPQGTPTQGTPPPTV